MQKIILRKSKCFDKTNEIHVFKGEKNADYLDILVPLQYNNIDLSTCNVRMTYITPDGNEHSFLIDEYKQESIYKDSYYEYLINITERFTSVNGDLQVYLTITKSEENEDNDIVLKSDTTALFVDELPLGEDGYTEEQLEIIDQVVLTSNRAMNVAQSVREDADNGEFTPQKGVDYFTEEDIDTIARETAPYVVPYDDTELRENKADKINTACKIALDINTSNYLMTISILNNNNTILDSKQIDFPLESVVVGGSESNGILTLTLQNGNTIDIDISDMVQGLATERQLEVVISRLEHVENKLSHLGDVEFEGKDIIISEVEHNLSEWNLSSGNYKVTKGIPWDVLAANDYVLEIEGDFSDIISQYSSYVYGSYAYGNSEDTVVSYSGPFGIELTSNKAILSLKAGSGNDWMINSYSNYDYFMFPINFTYYPSSGSSVSIDLYDSATVLKFKTKSEGNTTKTLEQNYITKNQSDKRYALQENTYKKSETYTQSEVDNRIYYLSGRRLSVSINNSTYVMTFRLQNNSGSNLSTQTIDLPLEQMVIDFDVDETTNEAIITLQNGVERRIDLSKLFNPKRLGDIEFDVITTQATEEVTIKESDGVSYANITRPQAKIANGILVKDLIKNPIIEMTCDDMSRSFTGNCYNTDKETGNIYNDSDKAYVSGYGICTVVEEENKYIITLNKDKLEQLQYDFIRFQINTVINSQLDTADFGNVILKYTKTTETIVKKTINGDFYDKDEVDKKLTNYLAKDNTTAYTPTADYHPATKKYVDDNSGTDLPQYDTSTDTGKVLTVTASGLSFEEPVSDYSSLVHSIVGTYEEEEE